MQKKILKNIAVVLAMVCLTCFGACGKKPEKEVTVYVPDGAPALGLARLMQLDTDEDKITYKVVNPTVIASKVTNNDESKNADICALPITAASKLLGSGEQYQTLGVLTNGNLYVLSKDKALISAFAASDCTDLSYLLGKTIGVMKINDMPGLTVKWIFHNYGLPWREIGNDGKTEADKINLKAINDATAIDPLDNSVSCYIVAEPAASVQMAKKKFVSVCSLERLYYKGKLPVSGEDGSYVGYPQAILVAKRSLIQTKKQWIDEFLENVQASTTYLQMEEVSGKELVAAVKAHLEDKAYATTLNPDILTWEVINRCGVGFSKSSVCKNVVQKYLQNIATIDQKVKTVTEDFFYLG